MSIARVSDRGERIIAVYAETTAKPKFASRIEFTVEHFQTLGDTTAMTLLMHVAEALNAYDVITLRNIRGQVTERSNP